ncbi:Putative aliphatic sulfonates-binding protein [Castellaniella defragrans]
MKGRHMKSAFKILAAACALACGCGSAMAASGALEPVKVGQTSIGYHSFLINVAEDQKLFQKHGFSAQVVVLNGDAGTIPALVSGSVEFAMSTSTPLLVANKKGANLLAITPIAAFPEQIVVSKKVADAKGITQDTPLEAKVKALKGLNVGILDVGGGLQYTLYSVIDKFGMKRRDVNLVAIKPYSSMISALESGRIDGAAPVVPWGNYVVDQDHGVMVANVWGGEVPGLAGQMFEFLEVRGDWADKHPDAVKRMQAVFKDAMDYVHKDPAGAVQIAHRLMPKIPIKVLEEGLDNGKGYPQSTAIPKEMFDAMQRFAKLSGQDASSVTYEGTVWRH